MSVSCTNLYLSLVALFNQSFTAITFTHCVQTLLASAPTLASPLPVRRQSAASPI